MSSPEPPPVHKVTLLFPDGSEATLDVPEDQTIFAAAHGAGIELPSMCLQGWCISCAGRVEGPGEWDNSHARRYYRKDRAAGFILLCTARPRSDLVIRTHQVGPMRKHRMAHRLPVPRGS